MFDPRPNRPQVVQSADCFVDAQGVMYLTDNNAGPLHPAVRGSVAAYCWLRRRRLPSCGAVSLKDTAQAAYVPSRLPEGLETGLYEVASFSPEVPNFPNGCQNELSGGGLKDEPHPIPCQVGTREGEPRSAHPLSSI